MTTSKPDLELRELELKVKDLELKIAEVEKPPYKKLSYWTSIITVSIAVAGIIGQSYLSSIKNEKASLESALAEKQTQEAKKETQEALLKKESVKRETARYQDSIRALVERKEALTKSVETLSVAYNKIVYSNVYRDSSNKTTDKITNRIIAENSGDLSNVLLKNSIDLLLKSSKLKVYYLPSTKRKAIVIDSILRSRGVQSNYEVPGYDISKVKANQIVYYNKPQLNYCEAVQRLLQNSGQGIFTLRLSSGANTTIDHFKIYVVK
jgi:hypothetical protein